MQGLLRKSLVGGTGFSLWLAGFPLAAEELIITDFDAAGVVHSGDFTRATSPFVEGGDFWQAPAHPGAAEPGFLRVSVGVEGSFYVYLSWARHPQGATDVRVRVGKIEVLLDQSRLANGQVPEDYILDDMGGFDGLCASGLYLLAERPLSLRPDDLLEVRRSDTAAGTFTSLDTVIFSPDLLLDDLGNLAQPSGRMIFNTRDYGYGPDLSEPRGFGLLLPDPQDPTARIDFRAPAPPGRYTLSANPFGGPNRSPGATVTVYLGSIPLPAPPSQGGERGREIPSTKEGLKEYPVPLDHQRPTFGYTGWQILGAFRLGEDPRLTVPSPPDRQYTVVNLLRLHRLNDADLFPANRLPQGRFWMQWFPGAERPWLREVTVRLVGGDQPLTTTPLEETIPPGLRVDYTLSGLPLIGEEDPPSLFLPAPRPARFQAALADGYGFAFDTALLAEHPFLWVRDLGMFLSSQGTWTDLAKEREAQEQAVAESWNRPFESCAEKYYRWTGFREDGTGLDSRVWAFFQKREADPPEARAVDRIARMPEVDCTYFTQQMGDFRFHRTFLSWPDHNDEFYLLDQGLLGTSSASGGGSGHPPAEGFTVQFGLGNPPRFREDGDFEVVQSLEGGYHLIVHTDWAEGPVKIRQTAFAALLGGESLQTGIEPLLAYLELRLTHTGDAPLATALAVRFTPTDWPSGARPLPQVERIVWRDGAFRQGDRLLMAADEDTAGTNVAAVKRDPNEALFHIPLTLGPGQERAFHFALPYRLLPAEKLAEVRRQPYALALERTRRFWDERLAQGAQIETPDPILNNLYQTFYARCVNAADRDLQGRDIFYTSPIIYNAIWHQTNSLGVADYLARRGFFEECRRYLKPCFDWQGTPGPDSPAIADWSGFFGAPPEHCPLVWLSFHGWVQWACARYFELSDDRAWLDAHLPALLQSLEWVRNTRRRTMQLNADGSRPLNYGWFPPGRVTDGSHGTSIFSDGNIWRGCDALARVLERIGHPRAAEFRAEADDYRACLIRSLRQAAATRRLVRLNDGTWGPYLPGYLETGDLDTPVRWYAAVVDGPLEGILDTGVLAGQPEEGWLLAFLEDGYSPLAPGLADEPFYSGRLSAYLRRDQVENFLYGFYSLTANGLADETLTTIEHRSWGRGRVWDLAGWAAGYWTRHFTEMLCRTEGSTLWLCQATPRRWLEEGQRLQATGLQTEFGPISFTVTSHLRQGRIEASLQPPTRRPPTGLRLRLRHPQRQPIRRVMVNGQPWERFDPEREWIDLPGDLGPAQVVAFF